MNTMTPDALVRLRQPFPPESVGKLPKSSCRACSQAQNKRCDRHTWVNNCPECHGGHSSATVHLDYVGHAAVTDRLLAVDPLWSWEPLALGPDGLPALDRTNNLWIKLTINGVTRIGVGDGKSAKECIGDAIRNAAMRFGVALDLWAKDDLVEFQRAASAGTIGPRPTGMDAVRAAVTYQTDAGAAEPPQGNPPGPASEASDDGVRPVVPAPASPKITSAQQRKLFGLFKAKGITEDEQLPGIAHVIGRPIESRTAMTPDEFEAVVKQLEARPDALLQDAHEGGGQE